MYISIGTTFAKNLSYHRRVYRVKRSCTFSAHVVMRRRLLCGKEQQVRRDYKYLALTGKITIQLLLIHRYSKQVKAGDKKAVSVNVM
jgi:hypothetical protein